MPIDRGPICKGPTSERILVFSLSGEDLKGTMANSPLGHESFSPSGVLVAGDYHMMLHHIFGRIKDTLLADSSQVHTCM